MQHDLFTSEVPDLILTAEAGRSEPRLWVRRLVIWRDPATILRDVTLRPGLNVIWSPDAADGLSIGHGGGKTTFCRLLRFCLGENSFASAAQRKATLDQMPSGRVGAEIRLDGEDWVILRSFALNQDWASLKTSLDEMDSTQPVTGMEPFQSAVTTALLRDAVPLMPDVIGEALAWPAVLAWMTRDQECRFSHLLDWRDKDSDSSSPVRGRSVDDRLGIVRAVLGAVTRDEMAAETARAEKGRTTESLRTEVERLDWTIERQWRALAPHFALDAGQSASELEMASATRTAARRLATALGMMQEEHPGDLAAAEAEQGRLEQEERAAVLAVGTCSAAIYDQTGLLKLQKDDLPQTRADVARLPLCSLCRSPLGDAHSCDNDGRQAELARKTKECNASETALTALQQKQKSFTATQTLAEQRLAHHKTYVARLRGAAFNKSAEITAAQQLVTDLARHNGSVEERQLRQEELRQAETERGNLAEKSRVERDSVSRVVASLSEKCDAILRTIVPGNVRGRAALDGHGLHLNVEMGGNRSTAAIESLKVIVFDVAVLTLAIEGLTSFPALLVHDSPREADLDLLIYHRLFGLIRALERHGPGPLFQYIITTTTAPPKEIAEGEPLRLTLRGAPASERLLAVDL